MATLVDEWVRAGLRHVVICPGSRSTPLAAAFADRSELTVHVQLDERSGGFLALGIGLVTGVPAAVVTTSGTAAVELHPAVVEAHHAGVPLLVCTADRPPELRDVGAPQTVDQAALYGRSVRWFADPGVPDLAAATSWRATAGRAFAEATGSSPGPVHLNLPFREPLLGDAGPLPQSRPEGRPWVEAPPPGAPDLSALRTRLGRVAGRRGLVVAGGGSGPHTSALAEELRWPLIADPRSPAWAAGSVNVLFPDAVLRSTRATEELVPEVILRFGEPPASRVVNEWCAASGAEELVVGAARWSDPAGRAALMVRADPAAVAEQLVASGVAGPAGPDSDWWATWRTVSDAARAALRRTILQVMGPHEPGVARDVAAALPPEACLVVSSSMPVRDVERYVEPRADLRVLANRGANGIDGVVSTAVGVAAGSGGPTGLLIGDLAFLHDSNGLLGIGDRDVDLVVVVVDNDGGGIFSFLPQAGRLPEARFEQLFGTPHGLDLVDVARGYGVEARRLTGAEGRDVGKHVEAAIRQGGVHVLVVPTDRDENVAVHRALDDAVAAAVDAALDGR